MPRAQIINTQTRDVLFLSEDINDAGMMQCFTWLEQKPHSVRQALAHGIQVRLQPVPNISDVAPVIALRIMEELKCDMNCGYAPEDIKSLDELPTEMSVEYANDFTYDYLALLYPTAAEDDIDVVEYLYAAHRIVNTMLAAVQQMVEHTAQYVHCAACTAEILTQQAAAFNGCCDEACMAVDEAGKRLERVLSSNAAALQQTKTTPAQDVLTAIAQFDGKCEAAQYTDTGEAWELLNWIKTTLSAAS